MKNGRMAQLSNDANEVVVIVVIFFVVFGL